MRFSQRHGYTSVRDAVQREEMDNALRVGLWNILDVLCFVDWRDARRSFSTSLDQFAWRLWAGYFKEPTDTIPEYGSDILNVLKHYFFDAKWYEVYDLLEFFVQNHPSEPLRKEIAKASNIVMEREVAAYRFVGGRVVETTSSEEAAAIEDALGDARSLGGVHTHLATALNMLADRDSPDYRNSIKESISAVEAMVNQVGGEKATLGAALKKLGLDAHPALTGAFMKLYGYTSDAGGIRHALMEDEADVGFEEAKLMLVACAAFVSYLKTKAAKASVAA